jgi:hypothetical protein
MGKDPQFLYMILILPSLFGLTLIGDGLVKVFREDTAGLISIMFGILFIGAVIFAYFFFSSYFGFSPDMPI